MKLTAITREQFATKAWWRPASYAFAAQSNILPVVVSELSKLVPSMPLGFVRTESAYQLVAITSVQPGNNCFVAQDGNWIGDYIPATVRAYPFQLVKPQDSEDSVLCFDESSALLVEAGQGEAFFDADGPSQAIKTILNFLSETEASRGVTQRLVEALQSANVIQPWKLNLLQEGQTVPVEGLYRIDEAALNTIADESYLSLRKAGALTLAYAQLFSMNQLAMLSKAAEVQARVREQLQTQALAQTQGVGNLSFGLVEGEIVRFS
jgi:hypothetical protein